MVQNIMKYWALRRQTDHRQFYEMNGKTLEEGHGAPLRLRVETQLGYKMVKWLRSIEFVSDYNNIGLGQGGHREDHMYYSRLAEI